MRTKKERKFKKGDKIIYLGDKERKRWNIPKNEEIKGIFNCYWDDGTVYWISNSPGMMRYGRQREHFSQERFLAFQIPDGDPNEEL